MNFWSNIKSRPVILSIGIVVLSQLAAIGFRYVARDTGARLISPLDSLSVIQSTIDTKSVNLNEREINTIARLNKMILKHKEQHRLTFLTLYQFHFATVTLLTMFSIVSGILAFLVGQNGWKDTPDTTRSLFLTCVALTSFYGLATTVYKQDVGINRNLKSYVQYDNLQKEILNFCSTHPNQGINGDTLSFNDFHISITKKMIDINNIYLEFDKDAVEVKDFLKEY